MQNNQIKFKEAEIRLISEKQSGLKLGDLVEKVIDNRGKTPPIAQGGYELLEVNSIKAGSRTPDYEAVEKFVSEETYNSWFRSGTIQEDDIIIPTVGSIGNVAISLQNRGATAQNLICLRLKKTICSPMFIYYYLSSPYFKEILLNLDIGGVQPSIKVPHLLNIEISIPDLSEQKQIAKILSSLDDKIELNRQINANLEKMASALFKRWFVDFEFPDENGNPYKSSGGRMIDSELGQIPEGWKIKPLDKIADFLNGLALQKYPVTNEADCLPVIKIRELRAGITNMTDKASADIPSEYIVNNGDILFSWSGSLDVVIWCNGRGALNQHLFKVTSIDYPKWFYYQWVKYFLPTFQRIALDKAVTMGHIKRGHLSESKALVPESQDFLIMDSIMDALINMIISNSTELLNLTKCRDTLLPRLMNGKIRAKI